MRLVAALPSIFERPPPRSPPLSGGIPVARSIGCGSSTRATSVHPRRKHLQSTKKPPTLDLSIPKTEVAFVRSTPSHNSEDRPGPQAESRADSEQLFDLCGHNWTFIYGSRRGNRWSISLKCRLCGDVVDGEASFGRNGLASSRIKTRRD